MCLDGDTVYVDRILYGRRDYMALLFGDETGERGDESESRKWTPGVLTGRPFYAVTVCP